MYNIVNKPCFCCLVSKSCPTHCDPMDCNIPVSSFLQNLWNLLKFMSVESVMNHLILYLPVLLLPSIFPSIRVFSKKSVLPIK